MTPLTAEKARQILQEIIAPRVKADDVRGAIAAGITAIGLAVGSTRASIDGGFTILSSTDAGAGDAGPPPPAAPAASSAPPKAPGDGDGSPSFVLYAVGGFIAIVLAYMGFMRLRAPKSD